MVCSVYLLVPVTSIICVAKNIHTWPTSKKLPVQTYYKKMPFEAVMMMRNHINPSIYFTWELANLLNTVDGWNPKQPPGMSKTL